MTDAIKELHDYLAKSPSVVYPQDVLEYLPAIEAENTRLRELVALWSVINERMSLCATTDCGQCPVREECGESVYLEGLLGIDSKELSWRVQERMVEANDAQTKNVKLRELLCDVWRFTKTACEKYPRLFDPSACGGQMVQLNALDSFEQRMRELGMDV